LKRRADRLARRLQRRAWGLMCRRDFFQRNSHLLAGVLGVLKAGGGYVPLDPGYPLSRLAFLIEDTRCR
jgi:non-ribosomal peptide synthetase component F